MAACSSDDGGADDAGRPGGNNDSDDGRDRPAPGEGVAEPTVRGPLTGGTYDLPFNTMPGELAEQYGYVEQEYVIEGDATAYAADGELSEEGVWSVTEAGTDPYATRILVRHPERAADFDGTVFVEWLNVTAGMDADPDFGLAHEEILRSGSAWVGVSAQRVGLEGGGALPVDIPGFEIMALKEWDPERYGDLSHPGDQYSYDIFSQAAQTLWRPGDVDVLDGLSPSHVIAMGESQSAARMVTYVNAVHPMARIYDGFLVHSRGGSGAPLGDGGSVLGDGTTVRIRTDLDQPVLQFQTETDLFGVLGFHPARQDDTDTVRTWEVAGTAHADQDTLDYGVASGREWAGDVEIDLSGQCASINDGPQSEVLRAAVHALRAWVVDGELPPAAPRLEVADGAVARDDRGIALGGIRTPAVDAPVSVLTGEAQPDQSTLCLLFGGVAPLDAATLAELYPTHDDYVAAVTAVADQAVEAGFLLQVDADHTIADAEDAPVPS
jgi:hypothetical protein